MLLLLVALCAARHAFADGGVVRLKGEAGPFVVTLFSGEPLRAGPADLSVLVQRREDGAAVLDAHVDLELEKPGGEVVRWVASREQATNRLLQASTVDLDQEGRWKVRVAVRTVRGSGELAGEILVAAPQAPLARVWPLLAVPAAAVAWFVVLRWLRRRRRSR